MAQIVPNLINKIQNPKLFIDNDYKILQDKTNFEEIQNYLNANPTGWYRKIYSFDDIVNALNVKKDILDKELSEIKRSVGPAVFAGTDYTQEASKGYIENAINAINKYIQERKKGGSKKSRKSKKSIKSKRFKKTRKTH